MIDALSNCDVMALGSGRSFANSKNSAFSFSRLERAAFLLFSFIAQRADKPENEL
jgi:ATP-dependent protease HslVU (ClpYQ) peptidase subunit